MPVLFMQLHVSKEQTVVKDCSWRGTNLRPVCLLTGYATAHNLFTGYGPTQLWVLRTSRYVVLGQGSGGQRTLHKSTPVPQGATAPQFCTPPSCRSTCFRIHSNGF
eukprot:jgi/Botrbrau1/15912/Bobra.40_1s0094.1